MSLFLEILFLPFGFFMAFILSCFKILTYDFIVYKNVYFSYLFDILAYIYIFINSIIEVLFISLLLNFKNVDSYHSKMLLSGLFLALGQAIFRLFFIKFDLNFLYQSIIDMIIAIFLFYFYSKTLAYGIKPFRGLINTLPLALAHHFLLKEDYFRSYIIIYLIYIICFYRIYVFIKLDLDLKKNIVARKGNY